MKNNNDNLKKRRLAEQQRIIDKRNSRNNTLKNKEEPEESSFSKAINNYIPEDAIVKDLRDNPVIHNKEVYPVDESVSDSISRLKTSRKELFDSHVEIVKLKYLASQEKVAISKSVNLIKLNKKINEILIEKKNDFNEVLNDSDDAEDRRETRADYRSEVEDVKEELDDEVGEINDDIDSCLDDLKEEFDTKITELTEQFVDDEHNIVLGNFVDEDLKFCVEEFNDDNFSFDALEEYDINDEDIEDGVLSSSFDEDADSTSETNYSSGSGLGAVIGSLVLMGVVGGVAIPITNDVVNSINATGTEISSATFTVINSIPLFFGLAVGALILNVFVRGGDRV